MMRHDEVVGGAVAIYLFLSTLLIGVNNTHPCPFLLSVYLLAGNARAVAALASQKPQ
jgi:hypothetical protein